MFDVFRNRLEITGTLWTVTALRVSAGRSTEPIGSDLPVIKDALGRPLIPGSSFKGALRSRLESFLRGILGNSRKLVANPANENEWSITASEMRSLKNLNFEQLLTFHHIHQNDSEFASLDIQEAIEKVTKQEVEISEDELQEFKQESVDDQVFTKILECKTDLISQLFGSPWIASKFQVRDLTVLSEYWFDQYQERDGVAIDRDTETAAEGKLYDFQVVPAGTPFEFKAVVENAKEWELGLLMIGLHQFETEQIPLGGGRSRGLGIVRLEVDKMRWFDYPEDQPHLLLEYLRKIVMEDESAYEDAQDFKDMWVQELISHLQSETLRTAQTEVTG